MTLIKLEVDDHLIKEFGIKTINEFMHNQLEHLKLRYMGKKIKDAIEESEIDHSREVEKAREEAWQEFKGAHLKDRS